MLGPSTSASPQKHMQKQDAAAFLLKPPHRTADDLARFDVFPIVGDDVRAPGHQCFRRKVTLDRIRPAKAWDAEEGRERFWITECGIDRLDSSLHLAFGLFHA